MVRKYRLVPMLIFMAAGFALWSLWAMQAKPTTHRVVIQLSTPDTAAHRALTKQLNNLKNNWADADVVVVVHNRAIHMLQKGKTALAEPVESLSKRGVKFLACEFTMQQLGLTRSDMLDYIGYTPYGLVEIISRQEKGYKYLKGGF